MSSIGTSHEMMSLSDMCTQETLNGGNETEQRKSFDCRNSCLVRLNSGGGKRDIGVSSTTFTLIFLHPIGSPLPQFGELY